MNGRRLFWQLAWLACFLAVASACAARRTPPPVTIPPPVRVVGSGEMAPVVQAVRDALATTGPVDLVYTPTNSREGLAALARGEADVALVTWLPSSLPEGTRVTPVGRDGVAVIVHPGVGVPVMDLDTLRRLFAGRYLSWDALGGAAVPVRLVSREAGSGTRAFFEARVMAQTPVALTARVVPTAGEVVTFVARHEGSVGYVSAALVREGVRPLALSGVLPTRLNVAAGVYPLVREVYVVTPDPPTPGAARWLEALASATVQERLATWYARPSTR